MTADDGAETGPAVFDEAQALTLPEDLSASPGEYADLEQASLDVLQSAPGSAPRRAAVVAAGETFDHLAETLLDPMEGPACPSCGGAMNSDAVRTQHGLKVWQRCQDCDLVVVAPHPFGL